LPRGDDRDGVLGDFGDRLRLLDAVAILLESTDPRLDGCHLLFGRAAGAFGTLVAASRTESTAALKSFTVESAPSCSRDRTDPARATSDSQNATSGFGAGSASPHAAIRTRDATTMAGNLSLLS
jgi:hypothetical protein